MIRSASFGTSGAPPAKQPFSFGGPSSSTTTSQPQQGTGTTGGFSFGGAGTGGGANPSTTAPAGSTAGAPSFSFGGASTSQPQQQQQQQPASTFSFGGPSNTQTQQPGAGTSLFGSSTSTAAKPGGFSFGQSSAQPQSNTGTGGGGLFGTTQPAAASINTGLGGSLFGGAAAGGSSALSGFGQSQQQQQQQQQQGGSALLSHPFYQKERFNDLSDEARKLVEEMDKMINSQVSIRDELQPKLIPSSSSSASSFSGPGGSSSLAPLGQQISALYSTLHEAGLALATLGSSLERELTTVRNLGSTVQNDRNDLGVLWEIGGAFRDGRGAGDSRRDWMRDYFTKSAEEFRSRILRYRDSMEQVSRHLSSLSSRDAHSPQAISDTLYFQHSTFMQLANQVAGIHGEVEVLKRDYRSWYAQQFRSVRDPFEIGAEDERGALFA
ncbi:hypothetical protein BCV69DRAFT_298769 [Microstroma glucosiphilum]|uniref:Uncharacterized protein n=1 Tax=Pseudomicrostroma glucosiphilum TaxID=1684307 RepID=A0A316U7Z8_9BASI|nr:hypothetical protein BCV69DRAFT_298769 [Pseudomicrostroma glucosiphilum]PWN20974.1 hypothetical protein BCV69DRAFT_298769 [Pseudomicrostroma glucosiphilum]